MKQKTNKYIAQICALLDRENITYELEYKFLKDRKFRFDLAFPLYKVAVEYEGIFQGKSRHTTLMGYTKDRDKYNLAELDGWRVLNYTAIHFQNNKIYDVIEQIKDLLNQQYLRGEKANANEKPISDYEIYKYKTWSIPKNNKGELR